MAPFKRILSGTFLQLSRTDAGAKGHLVPKDDEKDARGMTKLSSSSWFGRLMYNSWFAEILAMAFSAACLVALALVLQTYDRGASPQLRYGLTLNAIISVLASASKASLVCAVAGALSQLKWCWFTTDRKLQDLQSFDDASRGPWGSATLLFSTNLKPLSTVGALVTIMALAFDPFVQQVIQYPTRLRQSPDPTAIAGKASLFNPDSGFQYWSAINAGLWSSPDQFLLTPACPSGTCNWPTYSSVGWCSKCANVTSQASLGDCTTQLQRANSATSSPSVNCTIRIGNSSQSPNVFSGSIMSYSHVSEIVWPVYQLPGPGIDPLGPQPSNFTFLGVRNPFLVLGYAALKWDQTGPLPSVGHIANAEQCVLTPCVRDYAVSVADGKASVQVVGIDYGVIRYPLVYNVDRQEDSGVWLDAKAACWQAGAGVAGYENHCTLVNASAPHPYQCDQTDTGLTGGSPGDTPPTGICPVHPYVEPLRDRLTGDVSATKRLVTAGYWDSGVNTGIVNSTISDALQVIQNSSLSHISDNVAASLTKLGWDMSTDTLTGNITTTEVYVLVRWEWLILPIVLEVAAVAFLLAAAILTGSRKVKLWKSSVLPYLYHGLEQETLMDRQAASDVHILRESANNVQDADD
ncbi:hypothetical protein LTR53_005251 [Teratosphaeriaceae sp. CCFEE 6253]|nr:hypothetical protein LTR53_005251 [Teratosphaeriaceae sp. CCFEE 6253]